MVKNLKVSDQQYIYWTENAIKCPNCDHEIYEEEINEDAVHNRLMPEKSNIYQKFDWASVRIRCKLCNKTSFLKDWKIKEEHFVPLEPSDSLGPGEELVDAPLYRCPDTGLQVRPLFAEMCKDCACRKEKDCSFNEGEK